MEEAVKVREIDARDVFKKIQAGEGDFILLDVRTPQEYVKERISGSINLPIDEVGVKIEKVIPDKEKTIYVYCLSGSRSRVAVSVMQDLGYKNVYDMISGLLAWRVYKLPLEK
jgi:rhodanese-related sulfurtransferase